MVRKKIFSSYKNALDFCYLHNIPIEKIENHSSPKDLYWRFVVEYKVKEKKNG